MTLACVNVWLLQEQPIKHGSPKTFSI